MIRSEEEIKAKIAGTILALEFEQESKDTEVAHENADNILTDFLEFLGYSEIVAAYTKIKKYYS